MLNIIKSIYNAERVVMNSPHIIIYACISVVALAGCMTVEEQLNSPDPAVRARAEKRLEEIALGSGSVTKAERISALDRISNQDILMRILTTRFNDGRANGEALDKMFRTDDDLYGACIDRLDQNHLVAFILHESTHPVAIGCYGGFDVDENMIQEWNKIDCEKPERYSAEMLLECGYDHGGRLESNSHIKDGWYNRMIYAISKLSDTDAIVRSFRAAKTFELKTLMFPLAFKNWQSIQDKYELAAMLTVACKRQDYEAKKWKGNTKYGVSEATKKGIVAKIDDQGVYALMLDRKSKYYIEDVDVVSAIVDKMDKNKVYGIAMKRLNANDYTVWERDYMPLVQFAKVAYCKLDDETKKAALVDLMVAKIADYKKKNVGSGKGDVIKAEVQRAVDLWGEVLPISAKTKLDKLFAREMRLREIRDAKQQK